MLTIAVSSQYLGELLDPLILARHEMSPLFDVKLDLEGTDIIFDPPFEDYELTPTKQAYGLRSGQLFRAG